MFKKILNWIKSHNIYSPSFYKKRPKLKSRLAIFFTSFVAILTICAIVAAIGLKMANDAIDDALEQIERPETEIDVGEITQEVEQKFEGVMNIMCYGIDSRNMSEISRSDAIMLITIDMTHNKIKMVSIARDSRVSIPGYGKDKLNHAFAYGWMKNKKIEEGAALSIKTVNNTFDLNVRDYATANFWALAHIIDAIGGVDNIDVDAEELEDINVNYIPYLQRMGIKCELIEQPGVQHLTGGQAVAYCRVRHVGGTIARGSRHQEILSAVFEKAKTVSPTKYPELISLVLKECSTSLTDAELKLIGSWALKNFASIKIETLSIPTAEHDGGTMIDGVWYNTYDLDIAKNQIHDFILEPEN